jgi:hypothetical protein
MEDELMNNEQQIPTETAAHPDPAIIQYSLLNIHSPEVP